MNINLPKASVGLGTSGIGDNFARARLLMAQKAGYVQSTPSPYSQPGTALKQYQGAAPMLAQIARAQGQKGIPGLLRQGIQGRPPQGGMAPSSPMQAPLANFQSANADSIGNPFGALGVPQMPLSSFAAKGPISGPPPTGPAIRGGLVQPTQWGGGPPQGPAGAPPISGGGKPMMLGMPGLFGMMGAR